MLNLSTILSHSALRYPDRTAFTFMDMDVTFAQVDAAANQIANGLVAKGIKPGDKVALSCLNLPYFPMIYFGILKAGAAVVPLSVLLKTDEIEYHLIDSDAKAFFCFIGTEELPMGKMGREAFGRVDACQHFFTIMPKPDMLSPWGGETLGSLMSGQSPAFDPEQTGAEDTALIIYTSGTTGKPKGAELTHSNLLQNAIVCGDFLRVTQEDTQLIVLPLFHIFAMTVLMNTGIYKGAKSVLLPRFEADAVFGLMQKHQVSVFAGVPTMYWGLLNAPQSDQFDYQAIAGHLRIAVSGGASLPVKVLEDFESRFQVPIMEGYGMSEGSPVVTFNQLEVGRKPGSIGTPVWGVDVKVVDEHDQEVPIGEKGELIYRGHNVMKGYYNKPEANAITLRNGWMHSGDVAIKDEDGFFYIVDRTKDMIIRGGLNVYPREVEEVIMKHEAVSLVAVIGIPDEQMGEEIQACVVLKDGHTLESQTLIEWTKERIAAYKYPRAVQFLDALPMSATGKILKKELRKQQSLSHTA
ncbi:long-chain fatty acid--CoA ligase [Pontibacter sp. G13]|uniref:long-chain-fatty-acid--CoA ligase n=1 Tax=Pontibacter sp. G13 TaxID=3074898 RepID=UPI00288C2124|nr:long-chain fatty acid--CoA ligase [Pontibacter sp. G13]WNJ20226.1 long-chain fatty acid--CoA ligase [Pontibacter sp. G13]